MSRRSSAAVSAPQHTADDGDNLLFTQKVYWARMKGFAPWPARYCSAFEESQLLKQSAMPKGHIPSKAMQFFGTRKTMGWVAENQIFPLTADTIESKIEKAKLKSDSDYKASLVESIAVLRFQGQTLTGEVVTAIDGFKTDYIHPDDTQCQSCKGSVFGGSLLNCAFCDKQWIHWHCFRPHDLDIQRKHWVCGGCQVSQHLSDNFVYEETGTESEHVSVEEVTQAHSPSHDDHNGEKGKKRKSVGGSNMGAAMNNKRPALGGGGTGRYSNLSSATVTMDEEGDSGEEGENHEGNIEEDVSEDYCFVCGQDQELLTCDYPNCRKVYHQVCVLKLLPRPLGLDKNDTTGSLVGVPNSGSATLDLVNNFTWFCPHHFCTCCGALDTLPYSLYLTPLPATLYDIAVEEQRREMKDAAATTASPVASPSSTGMVTRRSGEKEKEKDVIVPKILSDYITQKKLTSCTSCPFSLCKDCEDTVDRVCGSCLSSSGSGDGIFRTKRHQVGSQCANCYDPLPAMKLAKLLEGAWSKMSRSRLALPFLRPMLPVTHQLPIGSSSSSSTTNNSTTPLSSSSTSLVVDLVSILENIHNLKYLSKKLFMIDLNNLRNQMIKRLELILTPLIHGSSNGGSSSTIVDDNLTQLAQGVKVEDCSDYKDLVMAFDTIVDAALSFLDKNTILIDALEIELKESQAPTTTAAIVTTETEAPTGTKRKRSSRLSGGSVGGGEEDIGVTMSESHKPLSNEASTVRKHLWRYFCQQQVCSRKSTTDGGCRTQTMAISLATMLSSSTNGSSSNLLSTPSKTSTTSTGGGSPSNSTTTTPVYHRLEFIQPRSILSWGEFVRRGAVPEQYRQGLVSGMNSLSYMPGPRPAHRLDYRGDERAKAIVSEMLGKSDAAVDVLLSDELEAAQMMIGMQHSALRETVSLFHTPSMFDDSPYTGRNSYGHCYDDSVDIGRGRLAEQVNLSHHHNPIEDETLIMLNRLQEMTSQTLELQARLKNEFLIKQRKLLMGSSGQHVISFAEAGIVKELKLANDNLRWRLAQSDRLAATKQREIEQLQAVVIQHEERIKQLTAQAENLAQSHSTSTPAQASKQKQTAATLSDNKAANNSAGLPPVAPSGLRQSARRGSGASSNNNGEGGTLKASASSGSLDQHQEQVFL